MRIVVPFAPGGGVDLTARILAQRLTEGFKQTFIVENRTGASGIIGTEAVVKAPPDGYTLLAGSQTTQAVVPAIYKDQVRYDTTRDLVPVTEIARTPFLIRMIRVLSATGMLGSGFREETLQRAMALRPDFIGADSGSTDPGPYYLGSGDTHFSDSAYKRDPRLMLRAARAAKIPVLVGSACTAGIDAQLERLVGIARDIAREDKLQFKLATIASEQDKGYLKRKLKEGKITPLANAPRLDENVIERSEHIVGLCGIEPYIEALEHGAEVIIAGRSSDTSIFAALPVMRGCNAATAWHMAKIMECGAACVVQRK